MKTSLNAILLFLFSISLTAQVEKVKDLSFDFNFSEFIALNDHFVFIDDERNERKSVWLSDGTTDGTQVIFESISSPHSLRKLDNQIYFAVASKLYRLDTNTSLVTEIIDLLRSIEQLQVFQDKLLITLSLSSNSIYYYDPPTEDFGTISNNFSTLNDFVLTNDKILFNTSKRLWSLDPINDTPTLILNLSPTSNQFVNLEKGISHQNIRLFTVRNNNNALEELWVTDGSQARTFLIDEGYLSGFTIYKNEPYFINSQILYKFNLTTNTIEMVMDFKDIDNLNRVHSIELILSINSELILFKGISKEYGFEYWTTDGTVENTSMIKDIWKGGGDALYSTTIIPPAKASENYVYFSAMDRLHGRELWRTDGSEENTVLVKDIMPRGGWSNPVPLSSIGSNFFFLSGNSEIGISLWKVDETQTINPPTPTPKDYEWLLSFGIPPSFNFSTPFVLNRNLILDNAGNIYVSGRKSSSVLSFHNGNDYNEYYSNQITPNKYIASFAPDGSFRWSKPMGDLSLFNKLVIATNQQRDLLVSGYFSNPAVFDEQTMLDPSNGHLFLGKFSPEGDLKWIKQNQIGERGNVHQVTIDSENNILVGGMFINETAQFDDIIVSSNNSPTFFIAKYDSDGNIINVKTLEHYNDLTNPPVRMAALLLDKEDNRYTVITDADYNVRSTCNFYDFKISVEKTNKNGDRIWRKEFVSDDLTFVTGAALGPQDEIFITGQYRGNFQIGNQHYFTECQNSSPFLIKMNQDGHVFDINTEEEIQSSFFDIEFDPQGNYYIAGLEKLEESPDIPGYNHLPFDPTASQIFVKKYNRYNQLIDQRGFNKWVDFSNFSFNHNPQIALDPNGGVILQDRYTSTLDTLSEIQRSFNTNIFLIKFDLDGASDFQADQDIDFDQLSLSPVPTSGLLYVYAEDVDFEGIDIHVFDALGRLISSPTVASLHGYKILDVSALANGVYFLSMELGEKMISKKFIKTD